MFCECILVIIMYTEVADMYCPGLFLWGTHSSGKLSSLSKRVSNCKNDDGADDYDNCFSKEKEIWYRKMLKYSQNWECISVII